MGGLAHYLEDEGVPTTQISLVRLHTEKTAPPRALWVPFELGRPLGVPGDAAFQTRVLRSTLALLARRDGPVILEDYPEEAPPAVATDDGEGWACPVSLPPLPADLAAGGGFKAAIQEEVLRLTPWYDMSVQGRGGRTTVGNSGLSVEAAVDLLAGFLDGGEPAPPRSDVTLPESLRYAVDDLKAFYREAAAAQPGGNSGAQVNDWFYGETAAGKALYALQPVLRKLTEGGGDPFYKRFADLLLIPRSQTHRIAE